MQHLLAQHSGLQHQHLILNLSKHHPGVEQESGQDDAASNRDTSELSAESGAAELGSDAAAAASSDAAMPDQDSASAVVAVDNPAGTSEDDVMSATSSREEMAKQVEPSAAAADDSEEEEEADGGEVGVEQQLQQMALQHPTGTSGVTQFNVVCLLRWQAYWPECWPEC